MNDIGKTLNKPLLVFDGDCHFCRRWIARWAFLTEDKVDYVPYQNVAHNYPAVPLKDFQTAVQLFFPDGKRFSGAEAVFRALTVANKQRWLLWSYENIPGFATVSEWFYRGVAQNRPFFSSLTRLL